MAASAVPHDEAQRDGRQTGMSLITHAPADISWAQKVIEWANRERQILHDLDAGMAPEQIAAQNRGWTAQVIEWMGQRGRAAIQASLPREIIARRAVGEITTEQMLTDLAKCNYTFGYITPDSFGQYVAGTWDDVRSALREGHISDDEFDTIRQAAGVEW
jgi:hypothetical protein